MADSKLSPILGGSGPWSRPNSRRVQVYVHHDIASGHTWNQQVFFPFRPRQCVVRQVVFGVDPERNTDLYLLRGLTLDNSVLAMTHATNSPIESGVVIDLSEKYVGPTLQFQLQGLDGSPVAANTGVIACILEFVE